MKIALINSDRTSSDSPLGIAYITSYLRKYDGFDKVVIVDRENEIRKIKKEKPDIIGFSVLSKDFNDANNLAKEIKEKFDIPLIIGGHHISDMPFHLPKSNFDIGVIGEGEQTMLELMQLYEKSGEFPKQELKKINGLVFSDNGNLKMTERRKPIIPLDAIPYPARDLIKMKKYYLLPRVSFFPGELVVSTGMFTSRGCPFSCAFCSSARSRVRFHSPEYVVGEISLLIEKYKVDHIVLWDDLFIINKERLRKIAELIKKEGINEKVQILANGRADLIDEETCKFLKDMNVTRVSIGLESGSEKILNYLKKGTVTVEQNRRAIKLLKKYGIQTHGFFIIGSPMETEEDLKQTLVLAKNENMDTFSTFQLTPLPNTDVWDYAKEKGIVSDENINYSYLSVPGFKPELAMTENISKEKFKEWYDLFKEEEEKNYKKIGFKLRYLKYLTNFRFLSRVITNPKRILSYFKFAK